MVKNEKKIIAFIKSYIKSRRKGCGAQMQKMSIPSVLYCD